jgi:hypothetical protein
MIRNLGITVRGKVCFFTGDVHLVAAELVRFGAVNEGFGYYVPIKKKRKALELVNYLSSRIIPPTPQSQAMARFYGMEPDTPTPILADRMEDEGRIDQAERMRTTGKAQRRLEEIPIVAFAIREEELEFAGYANTIKNTITLYGKDRGDGTVEETELELCDFLALPKARYLNGLQTLREIRDTLSKSLQAFLYHRNGTRTTYIGIIDKDYGYCDHCLVVGPPGLPCTNLGCPGHHSIVRNTRDDPRINPQ